VHYLIYKDNKNLWRWRLIAANERIIATSGESYHNEQDCEHGISLVKSSATAPVRRYP
jgi:uncharacterized protein